MTDMARGDVHRSPRPASPTAPLTGVRFGKDVITTETIVYRSVDRHRAPHPGEHRELRSSTSIERRRMPAKSSSVPFAVDERAAGSRSGRAILPSTRRRCSLRSPMRPGRGCRSRRADARARRLRRRQAVGIVHYIFHRSTCGDRRYCYLQDLFIRSRKRAVRALGGALIDGGVRARQRGRSEPGLLADATRSTTPPARSTTSSRPTRLHPVP